MTKISKAHARNLDAAQRELDSRNAAGEDVSHLLVDEATAAIVAAKPKRLTKAQKLAKIELETQAIEAQQAEERGEIYVPPVEVNAETLEIETAGAEVDELYVPLAKPMKKVKTVKTGVGAQILQLIAEGELSNKEIVAKVLEDNPLRKTTYACVAWYKSQVAAGKIDLPEVITGEYEADLDEDGNVIELDQE